MKEIEAWAYIRANTVQLLMSKIIPCGLVKVGPWVMHVALG